MKGLVLRVACLLVGGTVSAGAVAMTCAPETQDLEVLGKTITSVQITGSRPSDEISSKPDEALVLITTHDQPEQYTYQLVLSSANPASEAIYSGLLSAMVTGSPVDMSVFEQCCVYCSAEINAITIK